MMTCCAVTICEMEPSSFRDAALGDFSMRAAISLIILSSSDTVSSLFGLCSHKVDGVMRVWQCGQTASLPRMIGGVA